MSEAVCMQCNQKTSRGDFCSQYCEDLFHVKDNQAVELLRQWLGELYKKESKNLGYLPLLDNDAPEYRALRMLKELTE